MLFKKLSIKSSSVSSQKDNDFSMDNTSLTKSVSTYSSSIHNAFSCSNLGLVGGCKQSILVELQSNISIFLDL